MGVIVGSTVGSGDTGYCDGTLSGLVLGSSVSNTTGVIKSDGISVGSILLGEMMGLGKVGITV